MLRFEVSTGETKEGEAYIHRVAIHEKEQPLDAISKTISAIYRLYKEENIASICIYAENGADDADGS